MSRSAPFKANPHMLSQLRGMGFAEQTCHRALEVAQNSRDRAVEWAEDFSPEQTITSVSTSSIELQIHSPLLEYHH